MSQGRETERPAEPQHPFHVLVEAASPGERNEGSDRPARVAPVGIEDEVGPAENRQPGGDDRKPRPEDGDGVGHRDPIEPACSEQAVGAAGERGAPAPEAVVDGVARHHAGDPGTDREPETGQLVRSDGCVNLRRLVGGDARGAKAREVLCTRGCAAGRQASGEGGGELRPAKVPGAERASGRVEHGCKVHMGAGSAESSTRSTSREKRRSGARVRRGRDRGRQTSECLGRSAFLVDEYERVPWTRLAEAPALDDHPAGALRRREARDDHEGGLLARRKPL